MKRVGTLLIFSTLCIAADVLTEFISRLGLSAGQRDAIIQLNRECDEFFSAKREAMQHLQAKRAVNPAANVSSALEQLHSDEWKKLVETNAAVRALLSVEQREKVDTAGQRLLREENRVLRVAARRAATEIQ